MRRFFSFWWQCAKLAFRGNAAFANDWQWIFGNPVVSTFAGVVLAALGAVAPAIARWCGATEMTTGIPALDGFLGALAAFILTWLVAYTVRVFHAPVVLFHEQKDRADKLDGTHTQKLTPTEKQIASLREYVLWKPALRQREFIDYVVEAENTLKDIDVIFRLLATEINSLTKSSVTLGRKGKSAKTLSIKRDALTEFSGDMNRYADLTAELTNIISHLTPTFLECTNNAIARAVLISKPQIEDLDGLAVSIGSNAKRVHVCIETATDASEMFSRNFKGQSSDLNVATDKAVFVMGNFVQELKNTKAVALRLLHSRRKNRQMAKRNTPKQRFDRLLQVMAGVDLEKSATAPQASNAERAEGYGELELAGLILRSAIDAAAGSGQPSQA